MIKLSGSGMDIEEIVEKVMKFGKEPSTVFYNTIITEAINQNKHNTAINVINSMIKNNVPFDEFTYGSYLRLFEPNFSETLDLFQKVRSSNVFFSLYLYNNFIKHFGKLNRLDVVENVYKEIIGKGKNLFFLFFSFLFFFFDFFFFLFLFLFFF